MSDKIKYEQPPFKLDAIAPADLKDVEQDPAFQDSLQDKNTAVIHVVGETSIKDTRQRLSQDTHGPHTNILTLVTEDATYLAVNDYEFRERAPSNFNRRLAPLRWQNDVADEYLVIPGDNFDHKQLLEGSLEHLEGYNTENIPGTSQEWAAYIAYHELEHTAVDRQNPLEDFYEVNKDEYNLGADCETLMSEVEADIGAFHALDGQLSGGVKEFSIAFRIATSLDDNLSSNSAPSQGEVYASSTHDTGFHLAAFEATGEIPDYFAIQLAKASFFEKMRDLDSEVSYNDTNLGEVMTAAMHLRDSGQLSSNEDPIAQQLINSFEQQLGAKPDMGLLKKFQANHENTHNHNVPEPEKPPTLFETYSTIPDEHKAGWIAMHINFELEDQLSGAKTPGIPDSIFAVAELHNTGEVVYEPPINFAAADFYEKMRNLHSEVNYNGEVQSHQMTAALHLRDSGQLSSGEEKIAQQLINSYEQEWGTKPDMELLEKFQAGPESTRPEQDMSATHELQTSLTEWQRTESCVAFGAHDQQKGSYGSSLDLYGKGDPLSMQWNATIAADQTTKIGSAQDIGIAPDPEANNPYQYTNQYQSLSLS